MAAEVERFPSFFVRRELAVPVRLDLTRDWPVTAATPRRFVALLAVILTQRQSRLDMVYRLLRSVERARDGSATLACEAGTGAPCCIEDIGGLFHPADRIYLTEGWGDLLIVLDEGDPGIGEAGWEQRSARLEQVFAIRSAIFRDFLVDRTELILAPGSLAVAARTPGYDISTRIRLVEDRVHGTSLEDLVAHILKRRDAPPWNAFPAAAGEPFKVVHTPGRTDLAISFGALHHAPGLFGYRGMTFQDVLDLLYPQDGPRPAGIDMAMTTVGRIR